MAQERIVSAGVRREIDRQESPEDFLAFLTITHPDMDETIRVVCDPEDFGYDGNDFIGFLFEYEILTDTDRFPEARLKVQNVDRKIGKALRKLIGPPRVKIEIIPASEFDLTVTPRVPLGTPTVAYTADKLFLVDVDGDSMEVSGRLVSWNYSQQTYPAPVATQARFPGLYR